MDSQIERLLRDLCFEQGKVAGLNKAVEVLIGLAPDRAAVLRAIHQAIEQRHAVANGEDVSQEYVDGIANIRDQFR